jgi:hypothetical protein
MTTRTALRTAILGLATAAISVGFAAPLNAAEPAGARDIDWRNATLDLKQLDTFCPGGPLTFADGVAEVETEMPEPTYFRQGAASFGDVDRDGREDAVLSVSCDRNGGHSERLTAIYAYGVKEGQPRLIDTVTLPTITPDAYSVRAGTVAVTGRVDRAPDAPQLRFRFRWDGAAFQERTGKAAYAFNWGSAKLDVPFKAAEVPMRDEFGGTPRPCKKATVDLTNHGDYLSQHGEAVSADNFSYDFHVLKFGDVNRDGNTDVVAAISCMDRNIFNSSNTWNYAYTVKDGKPVLLGYLTASASIAGSTGVNVKSVSRGKVAIKQAAGTSDVLVDRTFRWTRGGLKADKPLPGFPTVDVAP